MTDDRLDRAISDTLSDLADGSATAYIDDVLALTARTRQRPAWTFPSRYLTMTPVAKFASIAVLAAAVGIGLASILAQPTNDAPASGGCSTPSASTSPAESQAPGSSAPPVVIRDCEPWIAYGWFVNEDATGTQAVMAVRPDGTDTHVVVESGGEGLLHVDWSHDGQRLAFDHWSGDEIDIWTADADGSRAGRLVGCDLPCRQLSDPAWSPDDTRLVVARSDDTFSPQERCYLEVIEVATLARTVILEGPVASADSWECYAQPRWSSDGSSIVFTVDHGNLSGDTSTVTGRAVATVGAEGPASQQPHVLTDPALLATHPDWHPSQDVIVFGTRDLADYQDVWEATNLYTIRADGTDLHQVTTFADGEARATYPTWTPDGVRIVFSYVEPTAGATTGDWGHRQLASIHPDGSGLDVVPGADGVEPRVRPIP